MKVVFPDLAEEIWNRFIHIHMKSVWTEQELLSKKIVLVNMMGSVEKFKKQYMEAFEQVLEDHAEEVNEEPNKAE